MEQFVYCRGVCARDRFFGPKLSEVVHFFDLISDVEQKFVFRCSRCGLIQTNFNSSYADEIFQGYSRLTERKANEFQYEKQIEVLNKFGFLNDHRASMLEVGCGRGEVLSRLVKRGFSFCRGLDADDSVSSDRVVCLDVEKYWTFESFDLGKFDFVYSFNTLNYTPYPAQFLSGIALLLKEGGKFLLEVPDINDPLVQIYGNEKYKRYRWHKLNASYFSEQTLRALIQDRFSGPFEIHRRQKYGILNHLNWKLFGTPGVVSEVPYLDRVYEKLLKKMNITDTLVVVGTKGKND